VRRSRFLQTCDRGYFSERNASYPDFLFDFKNPLQFIHIWPARDIVHDFSSGNTPLVSFPASLHRNCSIPTSAKANSTGPCVDGNGSEPSSLNDLNQLSFTYLKVLVPSIMRADNMLAFGQSGRAVLRHSAAEHHFA
jgi:hypothetical protein